MKKVDRKSDLQFARDEDLFSRNAGFLDSLTDFLFVLFYRISIPVVQ